MSDSVAVVDSTSGGKIKCTVRKSAVGTAISGGLFTVTAGEDAMLCQAGSVETTNQAHEDESLRPMIAHMGEVPYYSGKADNERVTLSIIANYRHDMGCIGPNRANPRSGSPVVPVSGLELWERERKYKAVIGQATSGSANVSLVNRSFGNLKKVDDGARGEAIHEAFFGQNGSGKTITAIQRLALRLAQHPSMGAVLLDIKGDLQGHKFEGLGGHAFDFHGLLRAAGREVAVIPLDSVCIDGVGYFRAKMQSWLVERLNLKADKAETASRLLCDSLVPEEKTTVTFDDAFAARVVQQVIAIVPQCYATGGAQRVQAVVADQEKYVGMIRRDFRRMMANGDGKKSVTEVVRQAFKGGQIIALDIKAADDTAAILTEVVGRIRATAKSQWKQQGRLANMAVYIDEAHRWIAEGDDSELAVSIKTGLRETRAYGVAWCIVSQSMAALSKDVLKECRTKYFGRGLGIGADRRHLEDCLGRDALQQYEMLLSTGRYFFMAVGDDVNIGSGNGVVDFFALDGDTTAKLIELNPHIFKGAK